MTMDFKSQPGAMKVTMKQMTDDIITTSKVERKYRTPAVDELFTVTESPKLSKLDESFYRTNVAKALYLAKRARPDILLPVSFLTTRSVACTEEDLTKLYRVLGYIAETPDQGITVEFGDNPRVRAWVDAAYGLHDSDGKSHTGASLVFGNGGPLYQTSVKQNIVSKSSTEAELVAFSDVASEVLSLRNFSIGQGYPPTPAVIYQDNNSTMTLIANGGPCSKRSKHIEIRHFWMTEQIDAGRVIVERCPTEVMWANLLTKPLQGSQFIIEREGLSNWKPVKIVN
jgi:hypothetical protein